MNLSKHDPETEMEMNMTPMIDVVFLLIIFFMIITDMTQQDLEELVLPMAQFAREDKPDPDEYRPIINIQYDGKIIIKRETYYSPEENDGDANPYEGVKEWLAKTAKRMKKDFLTEGATTGPKVPDEPLLIRADISTPFKHIQKIMEFCGAAGVQIWKVQLACSVPESESPDDE
ncbi:MAG TPA: biopolymer transporter ExbD [Planctomycetota bacterium]|nr:biopolymer transporter ExbD [Planctomycetota bacterium]